MGVCRVRMVHSHLEGSEGAGGLGFPSVPLTPAVPLTSWRPSRYPTRLGRSAGTQEQGLHETHLDMHAHTLLITHTSHTCSHIIDDACRAC